MLDLFTFLVVKLQNPGSGSWTNMSKALDSIRRDILLEDLKEVRGDDELHMFYLLLKDVRIQVRVNNESGDTFTTNIGAPQGDCASAVPFSTGYNYETEYVIQCDTERKASYIYKTRLQKSPFGNFFRVV